MRLLLNLFYRLFSILAVFVLLPESAVGVQISAIYTGACDREIGIILSVDDAKINLLNLQGDTKTIRRFEIIYIAQYPLGKFALPRIKPSEKLEIIEIKTLYGNKVVNLLEGWMTNYSDESISFFTTEGRETVVDKNDIWDIEIKEQNEIIQLNGNQSSNKFKFVHPHPFRSCKLESEGQEGFGVFPQHLLEEPILIKNELDHLQKGAEDLEEYVKEKIFYPRPQVYKNTTILGFWAGLNYRYGSTSNRNSNFIPALRSELSEGLYKFQRVIVTGTAPMNFSIHEEPQTQFFYHAKSGYFHFSFFYDFSRLLLGDESYKWSSHDLKKFDNRETEMMHIAGGLDYGNSSLGYSSASVTYGVRHDELDHADSFTLNSYYFLYSHRLFKGGLYYGFSSGKDKGKEKSYKEIPEDASDEERDYLEYINSQLALEPKVEVNFKFYRLNLDLAELFELQPHYSLIYKTISFSKGEDQNGDGEFIYKGQSLTNAIYMTKELEEEDLILSGFLSIENLSNKSGITDFVQESKGNVIKFGLNIGLVF